MLVRHKIFVQTMRENLHFRNKDSFYFIAVEASKAVHVTYLVFGAEIKFH